MAGEYNYSGINVDKLVDILRNMIDNGENLEKRVAELEKEVASLRENKEEGPKTVADLAANRVRSELHTRP